LDVKTKKKQIGCQIGMLINIINCDFIFILLYLPLLSNAPIIRCSYIVHHDILALKPLICLHLLTWQTCIRAFSP